MSTTTPTSTAPSVAATGGATGAGAASAPPCCENGRPIVTDPHTGQTICSCQYPAGLLAAAYSRLPGLTDGMYSPYATLGVTDPSAFYSPMVSAENNSFYPCSFFCGFSLHVQSCTFFIWHNTSLLITCWWFSACPALNCFCLGFWSSLRVVYSGFLPISVTYCTKAYYN